MISADPEERLWLQLQQIVPTLPKNREVTKFEVIVNVIEYITNLERVLEDEPTDSVLVSSTTTLLQECSNLLHKSKLRRKSV